MHNGNIYDESGAVHGALNNGVTLIELEAAKSELGIKNIVEHSVTPDCPILKTIQHHAQMMVDHIALAYCQVDYAGQSNLVTAVENLETAMLYTRHSIRTKGIRHDG